MTDIKLVAVDIDGTILHDDKSIDRGLLTVINKLEERGIAFTYITGRNVYSATALQKDLPFRYPFAINNGAAVLSPENETLASYPIDSALNRALLTKVAQSNIPFLAYAADELIYFGSNPILDSFRLFLGSKLPVSYYDAIRDYKDLSFFKILVDGLDSDDFAAFIAAFKNDFPELILSKNEGSLYVATSPQATKGQALTRICNELGIDLQESMVIGDNHNDESMLKACGTAVVMENSEEVIFPLADIVIGENNTDAVSRFLNEYFQL